MHLRDKLASKEEVRQRAPSQGRARLAQDINMDGIECFFRTLVHVRISKTPVPHAHVSGQNVAAGVKRPQFADKTGLF